MTAAERAHEFLPPPPSRLTPRSCSQLAWLSSEEHKAMETRQAATAVETEAQALERAKACGYSTVFTWTDLPHAHYPIHQHPGRTTHRILSGTMTIIFPDDPSPCKTTHGPGEVVDVDASSRHEVWIGEQGCTYVLGE